MKKQMAIVTALILLAGWVPFASGPVSTARAQEEPILQEAAPEAEPSPGGETQSGGEPSPGGESAPGGETQTDKETQPGSEPVNPTSEEPQTGGEPAPSEEKPTDKETQSGGEPAPSGETPTGEETPSGGEPAPEGIPSGVVLDDVLLTIAESGGESVIDAEGGATAYIEGADGQWIYGAPDELIRALLDAGGGVLHLTGRMEFTMDDITEGDLALIRFSCAGEGDSVAYRMQDGVFHFWVEAAQEDMEPANAGESAVSLVPGASAPTDVIAQPKEQVEALLQSLLSVQTFQAEAPETPVQEAHGETDAVEIALEVSPPDGFAQGMTFAQPPAFTLNGKPEGDGYAYAVSHSGGEPVYLSENSYTPDSAGEHSLRFSIVSTESGEAVAQSGSYAFSYIPGDNGAVLQGFFMDEEVSVALLGASSPAASVALAVTPGGFQDGVWVSASSAPVFTLAASPGLEPGQTFGAVVDGGTPAAIASPYTAPQGMHAISFAILNSAGEVVATDPPGSPTVYNAWVDGEAPVFNSVTQDGGVLTVIVTDDLSGPAAISVDGGQSWYSLAAGTDTTVAWNFAVSRTVTFAAGQIVVRDRVGNQAASASAITVEATAAGAVGMGGSGSASGVSMVSVSGRGGGGGSSRAVSHASATDHSTTPYDAVELDVESLAMSSLSIGDQSLDLLLYGDDHSAAMFTAGLARWSQEGGVAQTQAGESADTLMLSALPSAQEGEYRWEINGQVFRKLAASGVRYLIFRVGDNITALCTSGFTSGLRYDLLKADGVASKAMDYTIRMSAAAGEMSMTLTADGQSYPMTGDGQGELSYYNVYSGGPDLLAEAFGPGDGETGGDEQ